QEPACPCLVPVATRPVQRALEIADHETDPHAPHAAIVGGIISISPSRSPAVVSRIWEADVKPSAAGIRMCSAIQRCVFSTSARRRSGSMLSQDGAIASYQD